MRISVNPFHKIRNRLKAGQLKPEALDFAVSERLPPLDVRVMDSVLYQNGKESVVLYYGERKKNLYRVRLWLDGRDLPQLAEARYRFPSRARLTDQPVSRRIDNPRCEIFIWAGGLLELAAELTLKDGRSYTLRHELGFDRELKGARPTFIEVAATGAPVA